MRFCEKKERFLTLTVCNFIPFSPKLELSAYKGDPVINRTNGVPTSATVTSRFHFVNGNESGVDAVDPDAFTAYQTYYQTQLTTDLANRVYTFTENGTTYTVPLNFNFTFDANASVQNPTNADNFIYVVTGATTPVSNSVKGGTVSHMNINDRGITATHEYLHLMGLEDRYHYLALFAPRSKSAFQNTRVTIPMNFNGGYDTQYEGNRNGNMFGGGGNAITDMQWGIVMSGRIENVPQTQAIIQINSSTTAGIASASFSIANGGILYNGNNRAINTNLTGAYLNNGTLRTTRGLGMRYNISPIPGTTPNRNSINNSTIVNDRLNGR
ncbi:MAG: hypothetical protein ACT4ON_02945 [Bacteroidota bacterium]